jgi:hypothetical protein
VLSSQLAALRKLDVPAFCAPFAADGFMLGPAANDILKGKPAIQEFVTTYTKSADSSRLVVMALTKRSGSEGSMAWALDDVALSSAEGGGVDAAFYRVASLLQHDGTNWVLHAQAWTVSAPDDKMKELAESADVGKSEPIAHDVEEGAEIAINWMRRHIEESEDALAGRTDTLFSGSAPDSVSVGDDAVNAVISKIRERHRSRKANFSRIGGTFARTAGPNALYVLYNMADQRTPLTFRAFQFFLREDNDVRPVLSLVSVAMPPRERSASK